jgi:hypothetical protein
LFTDIEHGVNDPIHTHRGQSVNINIVSFHFHMVGTAYSGELATLSMSWYGAAPTMKERILLCCEVRRSNFCNQSTRLQSEMSRNLVCFGLNEHT